MTAVSLSIITVNLNNKAGLETTIKSVLCQSYRDYEFLLIDGGSEDGSTELIEAVSDRLTYWVSEKDGGIYQAMNKGIRRATGTYCLFLNSGDWLVDDAVLTTVFSAQPTADLLIGGCRISEKGNVIFTRLPAPELTLKSFIGNTLPHQATFIKTTLFEQFGLYEEHYRINADFAFWIRSIIVGNCSTAVLDVLVSDYNLDGLSSSAGRKADVEREITLILNEHFPPRVLRDYQQWLRETQSEDTQYVNWIRAGQYRYKALQMTYNLSKWLLTFFKNNVKKVGVDSPVR